ncbi:translocation/assembly module TamB domain-containing protein [Halopseudomonas pertucinogena]|uniref:Translocation/assembly module TamB n=1 Tax=Halopseudomonas pertucinogena TaxID=86175 RepID=A0ABQ2CRW3_9GAMM|nr:translocation/assembly module TamB domain-containing protein [Halopseudomonas pertucinogena]GGJ07007.1 translocation/assembly module TamB [Halopseudomonas pertucinogena]
MSRFLLRALGRGLLILLLVPLLLVLLLAALLSSESVNRWVMAKVGTIEPRLELEFVSGQLWQGWAFSRVAWEDETIRVTLDDVAFDWSPGCLRGKRLCIDRLAVGRIDIETTEDNSPDEPRQDIHLPDVRLPLGIDLQALRIGSLVLNGEPALLRDIQLRLRASGNHLHITHFSGQGPDLGWQLEGDLRMTGDWPLRVEADLQLPAVDERDWTLQVRLGGNLDQLRVEARSLGYLTGQLDAELQPLQARLPLQARWQGDAFLALQTLPDTLTLHDVMLEAQGDLESGIGLAGRSRLAGEGGDVALQLGGRVSLTELSDLNLRLHVVEQPERALVLSANAHWDEVLAADARLEMQEFPWQWLYPQPVGDLQLHQISARGQLRGDEFVSDLRARLSGVGEHTAELELALAGTADQMTLAPLRLETPGGRLEGEAVIGLAGGLSWDADLMLHELNPQWFVSQLPGALTGPIRSRGSLREGELELSAGWDIAGTLRRQPLALSGSLAGNADRWQLMELQLRQGENRITGAGHWGEDVRADLDIRLPALHTLWPGLGGEMTGSVSAAGPASAPVVRTELEARRLAFEAFAMSEMRATGRLTLDDRLAGSLNLTASRMRNGDTRLGDLSLSAEGDRASHIVAADLQNGLVELDLRLSGAISDERWRGRLTSANIAVEEMYWQLQDPAALSYHQGNGELRLGAHCWSHLASALCFNGEQRLLPDRRLDLELRNFPLSSLQAWLPDDFSWEGTLNAEARLEQNAGAAPTGNVLVSSRGGEISVSHPEQQLELPYDLLELNADLQPRRAQTRLQLISNGLGNLNVEADIDDPSGDQQLQGRFLLDNVQLDILRPFLPQVERLTGKLVGRGQLAGTLTEPLVEGEIRLSDATISGPELPVSFEQLQVVVGIDGQRADIDGRWNSGEGQGRLTGQGGWAPDLHVDVSLTGQDLPIRVAPYADLRASPDLHIGLLDNNLSLTGSIAIPEGEITVRELPPAAVRVSPDTVIVGAEPEQQEALPMGINADIQLVVGDQLHFSGFGLSGRLSGMLRVRENLTAAGDLNILDGRFRGYGQRLELRRAQILFAGPLSKPYLDIEAIRRVDDVVAGLRLSGPADAPLSEVFAEPAMAQEQALAYLILGRPLGADTGDSNLLGQAALALGMAGSTPLAQNIASSLGIDDFQLDTEGSGMTTSVVATGYITEKLSLRYGVGVFEQANQLALRYDLTRRLYLEAVGGLASSLDFFYRIDF